MAAPAPEPPPPPAPIPPLAAPQPPRPGEPPTIAPPDPALALALQALPEKLRLPLVLCYSEGMSYEEIAQTLRLPVSTIRGRIHRAKGELRKELEAE